jgi:hypothetical protein
MFTALESQIVHVLQANLSPQPVPLARIVTGPIAAPPPAEQFPTLVFTARTFRTLEGEDVAPPRGSRALVEDAFGANGSGPFNLTRPPLQPLRAVEVEPSGGGARVLLRERDDYTVDYVNGTLRLRLAPDGNLHVQYFTLHPLKVLAASRLRVDCRLEVFATDAAGADNVDVLAATAIGAVTANGSRVDGLLGVGGDIRDSGLPSLGTRRLLFIFDGLRCLGGTQIAPTAWQVDYVVDATMVLVPVDEEVGIMRQIAVGIAWDDQLAQRVLSTRSPILAEPVTIVLGIGPATEATLAARGITTIGQLASAEPTGIAAVDLGITRARSIRESAAAATRDLVQAQPDMPDVAVFLDRRLVDLQAADLLAVEVSTAAASQILAAVHAIVDVTTEPGLRLSNLIAP